MIVLLKRFILILVLLFSLPSVFSAEGVCCYSPGIDSDTAIYPVVGSSANCQSGDFPVGEISDDTFAGSQTDACKGYKDLRVGYNTSSSCLLTVDGNRLYDITNGEHLVEWLFDNGHISSSIDDLDDLTSDLQACSSGGSDSGPDIGAGSGDPEEEEDSQGGNVVGNPFEDFTPADPTDLSGTANDVPQETVDLCSQAGGPFGFYTSKNSCESFTINGQEACLYNPHLAGYFSTQKSIFSMQLQESESACVPKASINSCFDYKTKTACTNNDAMGASSSKLLDSGCSWIEYEGNSQLSEERGYCISNEQLEGDDNKLLNRFYLADRLNLIKDPSFEFGGEWDDVNNGDPSSVFQGNNSYWMTAGTTIYQNISNIAPGASYIIHLYAMFESVDHVNNSQLEIVIEEDNGREVTLVPVSGYDLSAIFNKNYSGYYEKVAFTPYTAGNDVKNIEFLIKSTDGPMYIDGVSMEYSPATDAGNPNLIFKPVEVISPSASSCELCFDPLNLNMCKEERANNLGDCSYMPSEISQPYFTESTGYLGREFENGGNVYMSEERKWESQSLANGLLFCEMYVDEDTCTDNDNYVNNQYGSLHSGSTLCKWDNTNNVCFKDSDNNDIPDVLKGVPAINSFIGDNVDGSNYIDSYNFTRDGNQPSDFEFACDTIPPTVYIYFTGLNQSGDRVMLGSGGGGSSYGDVRIQGYVNDFLPPACNEFNIPSRVFIDANITPSGSSQQNIVYEIPSNQERFDISIKDYFVNESGDQIITDGDTNIQLEFYDQSGNKYAGGAKSLDVDFDGQGPNIILVNEDEIANTDNLITLGKDFKFNFEVSDNSVIDSCIFMLEPTPYSQARNGDYNETGNIEVQEDVGQFDFDMNVTDIIFNTTRLTGDAFSFIVECEDAFGQKGEWSGFILVDLRTEFALLSPLEYLSPELDQGFYNENQEFWMASKDSELVSCNYAFDEGPTNNLILSPPIESGFFLPEEYGYSGVNFSINITGDINFGGSQGYKNTTLICDDAQGNEYVMNLDYYYDTTPPTLDKVEYVNKTLSDGGANYIKVGEEYYFRTLSDSLPNPEAIFFVDGTNSWVDKEMNLTVSIAEGVSARHDFVANINYNETTFENNFTHTNFESDLTGNNYDGEETSYEDVRKYTYTLNFKDKANNSASEQFSYFVDNSVAELTFGGDVRKGESNRVYTAEGNPYIEMNFNAPDYKEFTCNITASLVGIPGQVPTQEFGPDTQISFNLDQFNNIDSQFENGNNVRLQVDCQDQFGISPIGANDKDYELIYDNTKPEFTDFSLSGENPKYNYFITSGADYEDIVDRFVYEFENTQEQGYVCSFRVIGSESYICDDDIFEEVLGSSTQEFGEQRNLAYLGIGNSGLDPICEISNSINDPDPTSITFRASCEDLAGNVAEETHDLDVEIIFTDSFLVPPLEFSYEPGKAYPKIKSFNELSSPDVEIYIDSIDSTGPVHTYTASAQQEGDYYILESQTPINLGGYGSGEYSARAEVSTSTQDLGSVTGTLIVDDTAPTINLDIPDNNEGVIYGLEFLTEISGQDIGPAGFGTIELFINGDKVLENDEILAEDKVEDLTMDFFGESDSQVDGEVKVINGTDAEVYELKVVATDKAGNQDEDSITVTLDDSFNIVLENSEDAFARTQNEWSTRADQPTLNFRTTELSTCSLRIPSFGETGNTGTSFSFDVAQDYSDLSMESEKEVVGIIECDFESNTISKQTTIKYVEALPDYVLFSSEGFVITNPPYVTNVSVRNVVDFVPLESCSYEMGSISGEINSFESTSNVVIDMSSLTGEETLELTCEDIMGYQGPTKEYNFRIDNGPLEIENVTFVSTNHRAEVQNNEIFLQEGTDYRLELRANKKDITCDYIELGPNTLIDIIFNFFKKLFNIGQQDLFSSQPFVYQSNVLELNQTGSYQIEVDCDPPSGIDGSYTQTISIERLNGSSQAGEIGVSIN